MPAKKSPSPPPEPAEASSERLLSLVLRFERFAWDAAGVFLLAVSLMTLVALLIPSLADGALLTLWTDFLRRWFGWGALMIVAVLGALGLAMLRRRMDDLSEVRWGRVFALEGAAFTLLPLLSLLGGYSLERAEAGLDGGQIGWGLATLLGFVFPQAVSIVLLSGLFAIFLIPGLGLTGWMRRTADRLQGTGQPLAVEDLTEPAIVLHPPRGRNLPRNRRGIPPKSGRVSPRNTASNSRSSRKPSVPPIPRPAMTVCPRWICWSRSAPPVPISGTSTSGRG